MRPARLLHALLFSLALLSTGGALRAQEHGDGQVTAPESHTPEHEEGKLDVAGEIFGHVGDAHSLHIFSLGHDNHVAIPLPVIAYRPAHGLTIMSSSAFGHFHLTKDAEGKDVHRSEVADGLFLEKGMKEKSSPSTAPRFTTSPSRRTCSACSSPSSSCCSSSPQ